MDEQLSEVFESVLGPAGENLAPEDGPATIAEWDSVSHVDLIMAIESEFEVQFETAQIPNLLTVAKIQAALKDRLT